MPLRRPGPIAWASGIDPVQKNMNDISIGGRLIGEGHPCFIIAEAGINHNGDVATALELIDAAADAGVDCIKFQTFTAETFCSGKDDQFEYISQGKVVRESMLDLFKRHELSADDFDRLFAHAEKRGVIPLSTPCDQASVDLLDALDVAAYKVGSDDLVYHELVSYIAGKGKPVIFSTGMGNQSEIDQTLKVIRAAGNDDAIMLHCVSVYPTPPDQVNLQKISALRSRFDAQVGYSDHSEGTEALVGARALGAVVLEKHFTLDRGMSGPDHWFSSDPDELSLLVDRVRHMEALLGVEALEPTEGEIEMRQLARRSIVAARDLSQDHVIERADLAFRRPGTGLLPADADLLIGRKLSGAVREGAQLSLDALHPVG
jgi:N,N'-diacetyllegionaminate synthase